MRITKENIIKEYQNLKEGESIILHLVDDIKIFIDNESIIKDYSKSLIEVTNTKRHRNVKYKYGNKYVFSEIMIIVMEVYHKNE